MIMEEMARSHCVHKVEELAAICRSSCLEASIARVNFAKTPQLIPVHKQLFRRDPYLFVEQSLTDGLGDPRDRAGLAGISHCDETGDK